MMHQAPHAPYIPPEVHRVIAQHINSLELPNYRLVNKMFAEIGAERLFGTIPFHCSSASLARIEAVKKVEHLNRYCHTLVWDTNSWDISGVRDLHEWTRYFTARACLPKHQPIAVGEKFPPNNLINLANNRQEWEHYLSNAHEERVARDHRNLQHCFQGFKNLGKLRVVNGGLTHTHRGVEKISDFVRLPKPPVVHYRGESLYNDGAYVGPLQRPGGHAFLTLRKLHAIEWHLTKLRLDAVCWSVFSGPVGEFAALQQVLSFHLRITVRFEQYASGRQEVSIRLARAQRAFRKHHLMNFLVQLPKLQSLKLELDGHIYGPGLVTRAPAAISDLFDQLYIWPDLRKINLQRVDTTSEALLSLLRRQRSTLKILKLHEIWFDADGWTDTGDAVFQMKPPDVLISINEILRLEKAKLSGCFGHASGIGGQIWDLNDPDLARDAAEFLVHGGACPLNAKNNKDPAYQHSELN